jgi:hypothetical protein
VEERHEKTTGLKAAEQPRLVASSDAAAPVNELAVAGTGADAGHAPPAAGAAASVPPPAVGGKSGDVAPAAPTKRQSKGKDAPPSGNIAFLPGGPSFVVLLLLVCACAPYLDLFRCWTVACADAVVSPQSINHVEATVGLAETLRDLGWRNQAVAVLSDAEKPLAATPEGANRLAYVRLHKSWIEGDLGDMSAYERESREAAAMVTFTRRGTPCHLPTDLILTAEWFVNDNRPAEALPYYAAATGIRSQYWRRTIAEQRQLIHWYADAAAAASDAGNQKLASSYRLANFEQRLLHVRQLTYHNEWRNAARQLIDLQEDLSSAKDADKIKSQADAMMKELQTGKH